jgi:pimeloyl-ACP methyl ester carboxylesterase
VLGEHTLQEGAADVLALASELGLSRFSIVGHSMSSLIALHLAQDGPHRIERAVVLTPVPPAGLGADAATLGAIQGLARSDDATRLGWLQSRFGGHVAAGFARAKIERWRASADPEAVADYAAMFARDGLPSPSAAIDVPLLAVTGEQDVEVMRRDAVTKLLQPLAKQLVVESIADSTHYPMQETPPRLVAIVERFLAQ